MPELESVHTYELVEGWVAASVLNLCKKDFPCWHEYPTHSGTIEVGSFGAWPVTEIYPMDLHELTSKGWSIFLGKKEKII